MRTRNKGQCSGAGWVGGGRRDHSREDRPQSSEGGPGEQGRGLSEVAPFPFATCSRDLGVKMYLPRFALLKSRFEMHLRELAEVTCMHTGRNEGPERARLEEHSRDTTLRPWAPSLETLLCSLLMALHLLKLSASFRRKQGEGLFSLLGAWWRHPKPQESPRLEETGEAEVSLGSS